MMELIQKSLEIPWDLVDKGTNTFYKTGENNLNILQPTPQVINHVCRRRQLEASAANNVYD